ncbi:uncharacterized protein K452DRAFT_333740 [Aplosporella prunicola CBS 121167]|uniref:Heterokaryon incompatibility domain-containing protein n=1 Tax=Aplosporella prunicola CBS 121167 TaxID=1176127 RepID=A0A6A6AWI5_9PEZI|nr:uncharacterized protein K452DRAFT_333740 [Aplosporella prunicola CBS 121167]KAF2135304.1 hypothetical protein K452DRAFT_333740 [Aplosporella prunicola CBS 121167]
MRGQRFVYDRIHPDSTIRLLLLDNHNDLSGTLITRRFSEIGENSYYALSYCWGSSRKTVPLLCNGKELLITRSLASGIRHIRKLRIQNDSHRPDTLSDKYVWIDQVCINQDDNEERFMQVKLMKDIYSKAIRTIVWGGADEKKTLYSAFQLVYQIHDIVLQGWPNANYLSTNIPRKKFNIEEHKGHGLPNPEDSSWLALKSLFSRQWFYRIWVVQEVVVSQRDPLLLFGDISYPWMNLASVARWLLYNGYFFKGLVPRSVACIVSIAEIRSRTPVEGFDFALVLRLTFDMFRASDPRDRAYGILSMCCVPSWPKLPKADYCTSATDVYRALVRDFVINKASIISFTMPLYNAKGLSWRERKATKRDVPSWIPHWKEGIWTENIFNSLYYEENHEHPPSWRDDFFMHHRAAGATALQFERSESENVLSLRGLKVDTIGRRLDLNTAEGMRLQRERASGFLKMLHHFFAVTTSPLGVLRAVFMVTTTGDHLDSQTAQDPVQQSFCDFCAYIDSIWSQPSSSHVRSEDWNALRDIIKCHAEGGNRERFEDVLLLRCAQRRFFITPNGYLGIGPSTLIRNDVICILFGGGVPFLLRRQKDHYVLIGPCYVHGLMKGEAVEERNRGKFKEETFEIH